MKASVRYSRERLQYTGRLDRRTFDAWTNSDDGRAVLGPESRTRFTLFGRTWGARRLWRELSEAASSPALVSLVQQAIDSYLPRLNTLVYAHALPRVGVDLHRLIVVPRSFANTMIERRLVASLESQPAFSTRNGRERVREWLGLTLVGSVEAAVVAARPSPKRPLPAGDGWIVVGVNERFEWSVPYKGPAWTGHYYVLEQTRDPLSGVVRKAAVEAIARLEATLPSLSRVQRHDILRQAGSSVNLLLASA